MNITLLLDNPNSWIVPWADKLYNQLCEKGHEVRIIHHAEDLEQADIAFFLSCEKIVTKDQLANHKHNLVCHPSPLPEGKGFSPLAWQILEGKKQIPVTLFEAESSVDSGQIYLQEMISLEGHELNDEIKQKQGAVTIQMCLQFLENYPAITGTPQSGNETFYPRRKQCDSELDLNKTIAEQFPLLQIVDNKRYPAYFIKDGIKYILSIQKET